MGIKIQPLSPQEINEKIHRSPGTLWSGLAASWNAEVFERTTENLAQMTGAWEAGRHTALNPVLPPEEIKKRTGFETKEKMTEAEAMLLLERQNKKKELQLKVARETDTIWGKVGATIGGLL